ncbi:MAG TPA: transcriptional regulator [Gammaproteobacteria bacterium]|nr:transcriptional regulator [Gammaproteobacteria bacterium]
MSAAEYVEAYGWKKAAEVAERAGTNRAYFYQIAKGIRRPSVELAKRLVEASDNELSFLKLMGV